MIGPCERCGHERALPKRGPQVFCKCLPAERREIRNEQFQKTFLPSTKENRSSALAVLWGYLEQSERESSDVPASDLLDLICKNIEGGGAQ